MRGCKGQVVLFILLGLILLAALIFMIYLFLIKPAIPPVILAPPVLEKVAQHIQSCLGSTAAQGLLLLGVQGGLIWLPEQRLITNYSEIAYGYFEGNSTLPSKLTIASQLGSFVAAFIKDCIDFGLFPEVSVKAKAEPVALASIAPTTVAFSLKWPLELSAGPAKRELESFEQVIEVRLGYIHDILTEIVQDLIKEPQSLDFTKLSGYGVNISILPQGDGRHLVFAFLDRSYPVAGEAYLFLSAVRLAQNLPPVLEVQEKVILKAGTEAKIKANATDPEGTAITFSDDSAAFDIDQTGLIAWTPYFEGEWNVTITATDATGRSTSKTMQIVVEK